MDIATIVRIFESNPDDDYVDKRTLAIESIKEKFKSKTIQACLANSNGIAEAFAGAVFPDSLAIDIESAIKDASSSFVRNHQTLQMLVCALGASQQFVDEYKVGERTANEFFLASQVSSLAQLGPHTNVHVEALRQNIVVSARSTLENIASNSRTRFTIPAFEAQSTGEGETIAAFAVRLKKSADKTFNALIANALLDREEIDLLWWSLSNRSDTLEVKFTDIEPGLAILVSVIEVVEKLKRIPSTTHSYIAARHIQITDINLEAFRQMLASQQENILRRLDPSDKIDTYPHVFPLIRAILKNSSLGKHPSKVLHWCRDLSLEIYLLSKLYSQAA